MHYHCAPRAKISFFPVGMLRRKLTPCSGRRNMSAMFLISSDNFIDPVSMLCISSSPAVNSLWYAAVGKGCSQHDVYNSSSQNMSGIFLLFSLFRELLTVQSVRCIVKNEMVTQPLETSTPFMLFSFLLFCQCTLALKHCTQIKFLDLNLITTGV